MGKGTIDWDVIRERLAATAERLAEGSRSNAGETRRILEERARLAATPPTGRDEEERLHVLCFSLGGETYAVETHHVREMCHLADMTVLPCTPDFLAGVMNLRGRILAVVDLRRFFGLPARGITELNRVIVLEGDGAELGLLADSVDGMQSVRVADLQDRLPTLSGVRETFLRGVSGKLLVVLDGGRLLGEASLKIEERVSR